MPNISRNAVTSLLVSDDAFILAIGGAVARARDLFEQDVPDHVVLGGNDWALLAEVVGQQAREMFHGDVSMLTVELTGDAGQTLCVESHA